MAFAPNFSERTDMEDPVNEVAAVTDRAIALLTTYGLSVIGAVIILIAGWILAGWVSGAVRRRVEKAARVDKTLGHFLSDVVRYTILAFTVIAVLARFGVQTASLIAVFGAMGLAVGLAMQGTLSNVASGVMIMVFRPFKVDDYIDAGGTAGTVMNINLFITELATSDNVKIIVPNKELWDRPITNYSVYARRRLDILVRIAYGDDIQAGMDALHAVMAAEPRVLGDPAPITFVDSLGDNAVNLSARMWVSRTDYWDVRWDLTRRMKEAVEAAGLSIALPQREVRILNGARAAEQASQAPLAK
jgi:small conductance mechanosensitive channel